MNQTIVVIEDDLNTKEVISVFLKDKGYQVYSFENGEEGYQFILNHEKVDLVLLDMMLPDKNGMDILEDVRKNSNVPIIMLTAVTDEQTQLVSFSKEVDDFIEKPFSPLLLVKRVEAVLRRTTTEEEHNFRVGNKLIELDNLKVIDGEEEILLTVKESEVLASLIKNRGNIVSRKSLIEDIWMYDYDVNDRSLDTHIKNLRKKIGQDSIITFKGLGYKIEKE